MSVGTPDLDTMIEAAWKGYRTGLSEALDALEDDQGILIEFDAEGASPYVQALRLGEEVLLEAASNHVLDDPWKLDKADRKRLRGMGFNRPCDGMPNYWIRLPLTHVDQVASMAVEAMRDVFRILHPSYLCSDGVDWQSELFPPTPAPPEPESPATFPDNQGELDALIERTLSHILNEVPDRDDDGDIPIRTGRTVLFVRTQEGSPMIRLFALMARDVADHDAALREVDRLNRAVDGVKFILHNSTVIATAGLLAWPFAPTQFQTLLTHMCDAVAKQEAVLIERVGGRHFVGDPAADETEEDDIHPAMLSILQLDAERPGALRPKDAAKICGNDPDLLLELIRWNEEQEIAWRQSRDETEDPEEARACEIERKHAHRTVKLLRKALRRVLLG